MELSDEIVSVKDAAEAKKLCALLDGAISKLASMGAQPVLVAECPNKFNDAWYDDLWLAVQCGETIWEQSQYFEGRTAPLVKERATFEFDGPADQAKIDSANLESRRISDLRDLLRHLQSAGWRDHINRSLWPNRLLSALVFYLDQPWLCVESPNSSDGDVFSWDTDGMFRVGRLDRLDQRIGARQFLVFEELDTTNLGRLGQTAKSYFLPTVCDADAARRLVEKLDQSIAIVRDATEHPVALCSRSSRKSARDESAHSRLSTPESFCEGLRRHEGEYRITTNGVWPPYRPHFPYGQAPSPMSDLAKALNIAMRVLEDCKWRQLLGQVLGETFTAGQTVALFVDADAAVLMRDNSAFWVIDGELILLGGFPYPNCTSPAELPALKYLRE